MPRLTKSLPKYRKHRASGQAIVTLDGRDFYLGPHGTQTSKREYDRLVGEWQANGRRLPVEPGTVVTVTELCAAYWRFCKTYYVKKNLSWPPPIKYVSYQVLRRRSVDRGGNARRIRSPMKN